MEKKLPCELVSGDLAHIKGSRGQRYLVQVAEIPAGHTLVWLKHPVKGGKVLVVVPTDALYPITKSEE